MRLIRFRAVCGAVLSLALIAEGSAGGAASPARAPVIAVGEGLATAPPPLEALAPTVEQARADAAEGRARAKREADAFMNGSPAYRRAHTLKVVRPARGAHGQRGTSSLPLGNDACILIGDGGLRFGGPNWICWFNDIGVPIDLQSESNPAAAMPVWANPDYYCPSSTVFSNNNVRASMLVTENPTSVGGASSCNRLDGPVTSTFTRESTSTDFDHVLVQVQSTFTVCLHPFGNNCTLAIIDNMYVNLRTGTPWTQSATPSERACGRCNGTSIGKPIDVATGELWNEKTDLVLSGPFGMSFSRFYGNQTPGSADLGGTHWLHSYSSRLDVTRFSSGAVTYVDSQGMPYYFTSVRAGSSSYDNLTGMSLALSADATTYTLKSFQGRIWTFNAKGELTQRQDRIGNTQVVSRDTTAGNNDRILSVTDTLGRRLCFFYDASNRITAVSAWMKRLPCPTAVPARSRRDPVVTFAYDTGTNCTTGDLCTATDADGKAWRYEYAIADRAYPGNLTKVIDPVGHIEESNTYSGNLAVHQESGNCPTSPCAQTGDDITITYPTNGTGAVQIVDGLGRLSVLQFNPLTLQITSISGPICKCGGDQTRYWTYDDDQRVVTASDDGADGSFKHTVMYYYDRDSGSTRYPGPTRITELLDTQGPLRTTTMAYYPIADPRHDLVQTTTEPSADSPGQTMSIADTYSPTGQLMQRTTTGFVNGASTAYTLHWSYDARGRLVTETGPRNDVSQTTRFAYFPDNDTDLARAGQLQSVTDALGHVSSLASAAGFTSYDPYGHPQSMTDPNGVVTELTHDARGRTLSSTLMPAAPGDATLVSQTQYDAAGRLTRSTLPAGNSVRYGYDTSGRLTRMVREDASLAVHERLLLSYNTSDQPITTAAQICASPASTCPSWSTTASLSYTYSPTTAALSQIVNADGTSKSIVYSPQGAIAAITDERGAAGVNLRNTFDLAGRKTEVRMIGGRAGINTLTRFAYDVQDNAVSVTDTNYNVTTYHYDDFHRITQETSPVSGVTTYAYDADDNVTTKVNANGTIAAFTYDALDRMLTENDMKGTASASEAWTYDDPTPGHFGIGHLATMTDPSGSTAYTYDRRGNVVVENHNVGGNAFTYGYSYDANNNKSVVNYPDGTSVNYTFDFADRPFSAQQVSAVGVPGVLASRTRHTQSVADLRAKSLAAPPHGAKSELPLHPAVVLNPATLRSRRPAPPPALGARPPTGIDGLPASNGRASLPGAGPRSASPPLGRSVQPPSKGRSIALANAVVRRASTVALNTSMLVSSATYEPFGPITSLAFGNGTTQTISYDQRYRPTENKLVAGATPLADYQYSYDFAGNVQSINDQLDSGYDRFFIYDSLNRLTNASSGPKLWGNDVANGYGYDLLGNIQSVQLGTSHTAAFTYAQNAQGANLPLLSSVVENGVANNVAYDAIGSEVSDGTNTMAYGARELLGSALPNVTAYSYDGFRRRVQTQTANAQQRVSLYDGDNRLLAESVASASPTAVAYDYVYFGDRPVAELDANATHWTFADHLGTPIVQTDNTASVSWQAEHEPFGQVFALRGGDTHQPLRFPGQEAQQFDTGANGVNSLSYNGARWYHPGWGRYSQADPLRLAAGPNLYSYANSRPTVAGDPSGEFVQALALSCPIGGPLNPFCDVGLIAIGVTLGALLVTAVAADLMASPVVAQQRAATTAAVAQSCPNPNLDPNCRDKIDKMIDVAAQMTYRHQEMLDDTRDLYNKAYSVANKAATGTDTTWIGHITRMENLHQEFWNKYVDAVNAGCIIPPELFKYLREWPTQPGTDPPAAIP